MILFFQLDVLLASKAIKFAGITTYIHHENQPNEW